MCGIVGLFSYSQASPQIYEGLTAIQHRGQDAAGIATWDGSFHLKKGNGFVQEIFNEKNINRLSGNIGLGHVRYPTVGSGTAEDAQPILISYPLGIAMVHNGNLTNFHELKKHLQTEKSRYINSDCDLEIILNVFADELLTANPRRTEVDVYFDAVKATMEQIKGAYSVITLIAGRGLLAFRDPHGIRPLIMGERKSEEGRTEYCFGSESVALDLLGFNNLRDVKNGEAIFIDLEGNLHSKIVKQEKHTPCIFEYIYFARPDSFLDQISVYRTRRRCGKELAKIWKAKKFKAERVIPVPDSGRSASLAISEKTRMGYREGLTKNRYVGRTFIMPKNEKRRASVKRKLNTIKIEFDGKAVLLVDDSIVRGNTSAKIVEMARKAGAKKVFFASYSAPLRYPCFYGIDMQTKGEFIANGRDEKEIAKIIGADAVLYNTVDGMKRSAQIGNPDIQDFCCACFTGEYPAGEISAEELLKIETDRMGSDRNRCDLAEIMGEE